VPRAGAFLDAIVEDRLYALYHLAIYRGPRRGEILALRWDDLNLDTATIRISRNLVLVGGKSRAEAQRLHELTGQMDELIEPSANKAARKAG
jgi:integrase